MKKTLLLLLIAALLLGLCACGQSEASAQPAAEKERPAGMESVLPGAGAESDLKQLAESLIGESVELLYEKLGEPLSAEYAPSCLGDGEDGELRYEGFTVFTYRDGASETVQDVD